MLRNPLDRPVPIADTALIELASTHTGREYEVFVWPADADLEEPGPVIYVLDGQWDFKLVLAIVGALQFDMRLPPVTVVGISYGGANPDFGALRACDFTPTHHPDHPGTGQASEFLAFLQKELFPLIEGSYPAASSDRCLVASSLGGLFGVYALFERPDLFRRMVLASPGLLWCEELLLSGEASHSSLRSDLPVRLFLSVAGLEAPRFWHDPVHRLARRLQEREYEGFSLSEAVIAGERHSGAKAEAFTRGLRSVFSPPIPRLTPEELARFAGSYRPSGDSSIGAITVVQQTSGLAVGLQADEADQLNPIYLQADGADQLIPITATRFRFLAAPAEITFVSDAEGEVTGATLHQHDGDEQLVRVTLQA